MYKFVWRTWKRSGFTWQCGLCPLQCSRACPAGMRATGAGEVLVPPHSSTSNCQLFQNTADPAATPTGFTAFLRKVKPFPQDALPTQLPEETELCVKHWPFPVPDRASPRCKTSSMLATIILCTSCSSVLMEPRFLLARLSM